MGTFRSPMLDTPTDRDRNTDQWYGSIAAIPHTHGSTQTSTLLEARLQLEVMSEVLRVGTAFWLLCV